MSTPMTRRPAAVRVRAVGTPVPQPRSSTAEVTGTRESILSIAAAWNGLWLCSPW
jgi:hypothetical protein